MELQPERDDGRAVALLHRPIELRLLRVGVEIAPVERADAGIGLPDPLARRGEHRVLGLTGSRPRDSPWTDPWRRPRSGIDRACRPGICGRNWPSHGPSLPPPRARSPKILPPNISSFFPSVSECDRDHCVPSLSRDHSKALDAPADSILKSPTGRKPLHPNGTRAHSLADRRSSKAAYRMSGETRSAASYRILRVPPNGHGEADIDAAVDRREVSVAARVQHRDAAVRRPQAKIRSPRR